MRPAISADELNAHNEPENQRHNQSVFRFCECRPPQPLHLFNFSRSNYSSASVKSATLLAVQFGGGRRVFVARFAAWPAPRPELLMGPRRGALPPPSCPLPSTTRRLASLFLSRMICPLSSKEPRALLPQRSINHRVHLEIPRVP